MFYFFIFIILLLAAIGLVIIKILRINNFATFIHILNDLKSGKPVLSTIFQVDDLSKKHGGELVADTLKCHGVKEVFTLCGGHISPILVACEELGIRVLDTRHEATAVFAADAVARLRQGVGVAAVTAGPGITNSITALKNAQLAESPLLLLGGASPSLLKGRGALQDIDQQILLKSLCKFTARVKSVRDIVPTIRKAIATALSNTPGPVFVELPIDILYPYETVRKEIGFSKNPRGLKKILDLGLHIYISRVFSGAWLPQQLTPLPVQIQMPRSDQMRRFAGIITFAKKPILLLGSQAMSPPVKTNELVETIKTLGIPIYLSGMARGLLGKSSHLQMRHNRKEALREADVVILAGVVCDFRLGYGKVLNISSKVITINRSKEQMLKNHDIFWQSTLAVQADVASTLVKLHEELDKRDWKGASQGWLDELRTREEEKDAQIFSKTMEKCEDERLNPLLVLRALDKVITEETILVADGGDFVGSAAYIVQPRGPLQWLDPGAFGTLGVGAGFALGAKAVFPHRPVVILYGDGACGFSLMEFDSFVRHSLPVVALIGNDACWSQIARDQIPWFGSAVACNLAFTKYEEVGRGLGAEGICVERMDEEDITGKLKEALEASTGKGKLPVSVVINVIIGKTNFRQGSISV